MLDCPVRQLAYLAVDILDERVADLSNLLGLAVHTKSPLGYLVSVYCSLPSIP